MSVNVYWSRMYIWAFPETTRRHCTTSRIQIYLTAAPPRLLLPSWAVSASEWTCMCSPFQALHLSSTGRNVDYCLVCEEAGTVKVGGRHPQVLILSSTIALDVFIQVCKSIKVFGYFCIKSYQTCSLGTLLRVCGWYSRWKGTVCVRSPLSMKHVLYIWIYTVYIFHEIQCTLYYLYSLVHFVFKGSASRLHVWYQTA